MNPAAWRKVDELFHSALALPAAERSRYLEDACAGDTALRDHVMALLARAEETGDLLPVDIAGAFAALPGSDLQPGDTVGVYRIEGPAGTGGMGRIYAAQDTRLGRKVALKFLASHHIWNQEMVLRFRREARLTSNLNHPNIVTVHDVGQMGSSTYIVTEFIEGETLRTRMLRAPLPAGEVFHLMRQIVSALAAAHSRGIVHRDIKPENIMIRPDGVVKVLDFGLARPHEDATTDTAALKTVSGAVLGTLPYMSPEQVRGRTVDVRTDLWSLGVLLFELFEQKRPFTGDTPNHVAVSILESAVPPMTHTPARLEPLIRRLLEKNRHDRPSSAAKLAPWFEVLPVQAKDSRADVFRWVAAVIAATALLTAAVLVWRRIPSAPGLLTPRQVTNWTDVMLAAISPDGQYLAYVRGREGAQSLWVRNIDTLADRRLTEDSTDRYRGLTFSNDAHYVYCVVYSAGLTSDLVRVSIWDEQRFKAHSNLDSSIAFAPDGDRFAFVRMMPEVRSLVVARLSDQSEQEILTKKPPAGFSITGPAWSPDGQKIAVVTQDPDGNSPVALTTVDVASHRTETLASGFHFLGRPVWLARGVIVGASRQGEPSQLLLVSPSRPEGVALTNDLSAYAVTTATLRGDVIASLRYAFRSWISFTSLQTDPPRVERMHALSGQPGAERFRGVRWLDRGKLIVPISSGLYTNLWAIRPPPGQRQPLTSGEHFAADGAPCGTGGVVFVSRRTGEASIRFLDLKTNIVRPVVSKVVNPELPQCTPDGRTVIYLASRDGVISLWSVDRDGNGTPRRLTDQVTRNAALSPDGSQIVTQFSEAGTGGIWRVVLLPLEGGAPLRSFSGVPSTSPLRWHPSGKAFTYLLTRQSTAEFWNQSVDGKPAVRVAAFAEPGRVTDFDWSPDGILSYVTAIADQDAVILR